MRTPAATARDIESKYRALPVGGSLTITRARHGDGPSADLTEISKRANGTLPKYMVFRTIDGREPVRGTAASTAVVGGCLDARD